MNIENTRSPRALSSILSLCSPILSYALFLIPPNSMQIESPPPAGMLFLLQAHRGPQNSVGSFLSLCVRARPRPLMLALIMWEPRRLITLRSLLDDRRSIYLSIMMIIIGYHILPFHRSITTTTSIVNQSVCFHWACFYWASLALSRFPCFGFHLVLLATTSSVLFDDKCQAINLCKYTIPASGTCLSASALL